MTILIAILCLAGWLSAFMAGVRWREYVLTKARRNATIARIILSPAAQLLVVYLANAR